MRSEGRTCVEVTFGVEAKRRQLLELTDGGSGQAAAHTQSNALDQAVRAAWEHLWELSLAPAGG